jgi:hypothetical protein
MTPIASPSGPPHTDRSMVGETRPSREATRWRPVKVGLSAVLVVVAVGACSAGSGSPSKVSTSTSPTAGSQSGGGSSGGTAGQGLLTCLRQHGAAVPTTTPGETFPSGASGPGEGATPPGAVGATGSSAALRACQSQFPAGGGGTPSGGQQRLGAFVSCMADHGVKVTIETPGSGGLGPVDRASTAYKTCSPLLPTGGPSTPTTTTP